MYQSGYVPVKVHRGGAGPARRSSASRRSAPGTADVDALFAGSDSITRGVLDVLHQEGIDVPGQIAVIGFDKLSPLPPPAPQHAGPVHQLGDLGSQEGRCASGVTTTGLGAFAGGDLLQIGEAVQLGIDIHARVDPVVQPDQKHPSAPRTFETDDHSQLSAEVLHAEVIDRKISRQPISQRRASFGFEQVEESLVAFPVLPPQPGRLLCGPWSFGNPGAHRSILELRFFVPRWVTRSDDSALAALHLVDACGEIVAFGQCSVLEAVPDGFEQVAITALLP